jgi:phospholipid transport system substrate-binding protein
MLLIRRSFLALAAGAAALPLVAKAQAVTATDGADAFVRGLGGDAIRMLSDKSLDASQREIEFRRLLIKDFDVDEISRFALGRFWRQASDEQKAAYRRLFEDYIVMAYATRLGQYSGQTFAVKDERPVEQGDVVVVSEIDQPSGPPIHVDWRCRKAGDKFKIVDVVVEGVSMAITQRQEFASVIQNGGGNVAVLIDQLRKKTVKDVSSASSK